uniref:Cation channel complex component UNC80 N-terminal domain-containing protein n=1 Tax=Eptatretus burgeri TaxID=7764 RepID=A0A8C4QH78_EPTBU
MGKRKTSQGLAQEGHGDSGIPLPIQTFLWRQTSAFIRPKLGKQYEASCVDKLGVAETKLLHTLHWMLLDSAQDCCENASRIPSLGMTDGEARDRTTDGVWEEYRLPLSTVELFVYLLAPLINRIRESDLTFRLAGGMAIWQPLWEHLQPEVPAFTAPIGSGRTTAKTSCFRATASPQASVCHGRKEG